MKKNLFYFFIFIFSLNIFTNCASLKPTPSEKFKNKIKKAFDGGIISRSTYSSYPSISPDLKKKISPAIGGDLYLTDFDGTNEVLLFNREKAREFDRMKDLSSVLSKKDPGMKNLSEEISVVEGSIGMMGSGVGKGIEFGKNQMEILDIAWSPDSKKVGILIFSLWTKKAILYLFNIENKSKKVINKFYPPYNRVQDLEHSNEKTIQSAGISWKSNTTIIYSLFFKKSYYLIEFNFKTNKEKLISKNREIRAYYSPDNSKIAVLKPGGAGGSTFTKYFSTLNLYLTNNQFKGRQLITKGIRSNRRVSWSKNGKFIAYIIDSPSIMSPTHTLYYYDLEQGKSIEVCKGDFINTPMFSPDNEIYFFLMNNHIFKVQIP